MFHRLIATAAVALTLGLGGPAAALSAPLFPMAATDTGHESGCFRTGNGNECCHAGPVRYHCHRG